MFKLIFILFLIKFSYSLNHGAINCKECEKPKFTAHYRFRKCQPVMRKDCTKCIERYECPEYIKPKKGSCEYNGKIYSFGELIDVDDPCRKCYCTEDKSSNNGCLYIECPKEAFGLPPYPPKYLDEVNRDQEFYDKYKNCYYYHKLNQCCGKSVCPTPSEMANINKCVYKNTTFLIGERFYPEEDECISCICSEDFDPKNVLASKGCHEVKCGFDYQKLTEGCIPIYWMTGCCPIDYYCPMKSPTKAKICSQKADYGYCKGYLTRYYFDKRTKSCKKFNYSGCGGTANNFLTAQSCKNFCILEEKESFSFKPSLKKCYFDKKSYNIGQTLDIGDKSVSCICKIPPDFTCIRGSEDEMM